MLANYEGIIQDSNDDSMKYFYWMGELASPDLTDLSADMQLIPSLEPVY